MADRWIPNGLSDQTVKAGDVKAGDAKAGDPRPMFNPNVNPDAWTKVSPI